MDNEIIKFDPTTERLLSLVERTKTIQASDLKDKAQLEVVRTTRIELKKARVEIEKQGLAYREKATAFNRAVKAEENRLIAIITPEEERLQAIENEAKKLALIEERKLKLPERRERLAVNMSDGTETDEFLLAMDDVAFDNYSSGVLMKYLEAQRLEQAAEKQRLDEEKAAIEREREREKREKEESEKRALRERRVLRENQLFSLGFRLASGDYKFLDLEVPGSMLETLSDDAWSASIISITDGVIDAKKREDDRLAENIRIEKEKAVEEERARAEKEKRDEEARLLKEKEEADLKSKREQAELEEKKRYQKFLATNGWTEETKDDFIIQRSASFVVLFKKVGSFKI
jgi:hypothetical protein